MAAKFFTGLPLDGPDPECVKGFGELQLASVEPCAVPRPSLDHSRPASHAGRAAHAAPAGGPPLAGAPAHVGGPTSAGPPTSAGGGAVPVTLQRRRPDRACDENPLAAFGR